MKALERDDLPHPWLARLAAERGIYYGWVVVAVTMLILLAAAGIRQAAGVVIKPLEGEFGWSRSEISASVFMNLLGYGLGGPFGGRLMDRFGVRGVTLAALVSTLIGSAGTVMMHSLVELYFWWGIVVGLGSGMLSVILGDAVASRCSSRSGGW